MENGAIKKGMKVGIGERVGAYWSRSIPRYENLRKVLFFLSSAERISLNQRLILTIHV